MVDKTKFASTSFSIKVVEKKMKSVYCFKYDEILNLMNVYYQWLLKYWHLPKRGAKIGVDERCLRFDGAIRAEVKRKFESMRRLLGKLTQVYFWKVVSLRNNELKGKRVKRSFHFMWLVWYMYTYIYVSVIKRMIGACMGVKEEELLWVCHNWESKTEVICVEIADKNNWGRWRAWVAPTMIIAAPASRKVNERIEEFCEGEIDN